MFLKKEIRLFTKQFISSGLAYIKHNCTRRNSLIRITVREYSYSYSLHSHINGIMHQDNVK